MIGGAPWRDGGPVSDQVGGAQERDMAGGRRTAPAAHDPIDRGLYIGWSRGNLIKGLDFNQA
jgi:hypothetical protein